MNFARSCSSSIRTFNRAGVGATTGSRRRPFSAFSPSNPSLKKASSRPRAVEFEEEEFQEDEFDDLDTPSRDLLENVSPSGTRGRSDRYSDALARIERINSQPLFKLASSTPSTSLVTALLTHSTTQDLPKTLEVIKQWRKKRLPLLADQAVEILVKRLSESESLLNPVEVLADRLNYGVEIKDIKQLYPLFIKLSKPPSRDQQTSISSTSTLFDLLTLAQQHSPSTTVKDSFAHVATLAQALSSSPSRSSVKIDGLISHVQSLGEDYILQEVQQSLSKKLQVIMRMRGMRVTDELKKKQRDEEFEWFAHLTERLVILTK